jgi:hypothetical protein
MHHDEHTIVALSEDSALDGNIPNLASAVDVEVDSRIGNFLGLKEVEALDFVP